MDAQEGRATAKQVPEAPMTRTFDAAGIEVVTTRTPRSGEEEA